MDSIILILISTLIFVPYIIWLCCRRAKPQGTKTIQMNQVEAGPTTNILNIFRRKTDLTKTVEINIEGIRMDKKLRYFVVKNKCMKPKGISDGDIIGVRMFDGNFKPEELKEGEILLIYLDNEHFKGYKIREKGALTMSGTAYDTYYYKRGKKRKSSKPHAIETIKGVVTEIYCKEYLQFN